MRFWTGLYAEVDREMLVNGVNTMLQVAARLLLPKEPIDAGPKRLKLGDDEEENP